MRVRIPLAAPWIFVMKRVGTESEQKLIDIIFDIVMTMDAYPNSFKDMDRDAKAAWVRKQLDGCGYKTIPMGSLWGVLVDEYPERYKNED